MPTKSYISFFLTLIWILIFATFSLSRIRVGAGMVGQRRQVHSKMFDENNNNNNNHCANRIYGNAKHQLVRDDKFEQGASYVLNEAESREEIWM